MALFYMVGVIAAGFSNILNYGFINMPDSGPVHTWRWIFVMLGALTMLLGFFAWFLVVDFPAQNTFLSKEDTQFVIDRVNEDRGDAIPDEVTLRKVLRHLVCWRTWVFGYLFMSSSLPVSKVRSLRL